MKEYILYLILSHDHSEIQTIRGDRFIITTIQATPDDIDNNIGDRWFCGKRFSTIYCDAKLYSLRKEFCNYVKSCSCMGKKEFILI